MLAISSEPEIISKGDNEEGIRQPNLDENKQNPSILALTLDEIQCRSRKSFGSMNMEEFISNIWSVDQLEDVSAVGLSSDDNNNINKSNSHNNNNGSGGGVWMNGSFSIPTPLCNKTVDEIWLNLHNEATEEEEEDTRETELGEQEAREADLRRQQTLGQMTLEDFLLKAGVVRLQSTNSNSSNPMMLSPTPSLYELTSGNHHDHHHHDDHHHHQAIGGSGGESSGRKRRIIDGPPEVLVERRQRRMIKNRESAARSRARKQAYTVELEVELNQLREENDKLKQVLAEAELKRKEVLMKRKQYTTRAQKMVARIRKIRRAASLTW